MSVVFKKKEMANNVNEDGSEHEHKTPLSPHMKLIELSDYRREILRKRANLAKCSVEEIQELDVSRLGAKRQTSRAERLFDKMIEDDKFRKEQEAAEMRTSEKTLIQCTTFKPLRRKMPNAKKPSASTTQEDLNKITVIPGLPLKRKCVDFSDKTPLPPELKLVESSDYRKEILRKRADLAKFSLEKAQEDGEPRQPPELYVSRLGSKRQRSRAGRLFDKMIEDDKKRKERETGMQAFRKTLQQSDEESHENDHDDNNNGTAEMPLKSKIPNAKKPSASTTQEDWDKTTVIPGTPIRSENL